MVRGEVMSVVTILPVQIIFELKRVEDLELILTTVENVRKMHPDTTIAVEIRVQPED